MIVQGDQVPDALDKHRQAPVTGDANAEHEPDHPGIARDRSLANSVVPDFE
jgi:hypothetical protein